MRELRDDYHREMERLGLDRRKLKADMEKAHAEEIRMNKIK